MSKAETRADQRRDDARSADFEARCMELGTADVSGFSDWLYGECDGVPAVQLREVIRDVTAEDFRNSTREALAVAMDVGQPAATRIAALDSLIEGHAAWVAAWAEQVRQRAQALAVVQQFTRKVAA